MCAARRVRGLGEREPALWLRGLKDADRTPDPLACVEVRSLFTALCYVTGGTLAIPPDALAALATEATSATAQQINRIAAA